MVRVTAEGLIATGFVGFPRALWDASFSLFPYTGEARRVAFRSIYHLKIGTIPLGEPPILTEVLLSDDDVLWGSYALFLLDPRAACLDSCKQSTV